MDQEAADELIHLKLHDARSLFAFAAIILPPKMNLAVCDIENAVIGNRHTVRVTAQIIENLPRAAEGMFDINDPLRVLQRRKVAAEGGFVSEGFKLPEEVQFLFLESFAQSFEKEAAEQT